MALAKVLQLRLKRREVSTRKL